MIEFKNSNESSPMQIFHDIYLEAKKNEQDNIDAISISSFNHDKNEVSSRIVNIKFIKNGSFFFFSNYFSPKSKDFISHDQVSGLIFWSKINKQIRIKAKIKKCSDTLSDQHFLGRAYKKNITSILSKQSSNIKSFEYMEKIYNEYFYKYKNKKLKRPEYWGGYEMSPYYFEFWSGDDNRLNKRIVYKKENGVWSYPYYLQP
tara:strand:+ start:1055 stop:1660 length:606 start_codon:yes stop_codon:yes gene_type:complete